MIIETKRLIIRDFKENDFEDIFEYLSDPIAMKYIEPPFNMIKTKEFIHKCGIERSLVFALREKLSKRIIGHTIFHQYDRPLEYEIGWVLNRKFHGEGYAKEISIALFDYGFNNLKLKKL